MDKKIIFLGILLVSIALVTAGVYFIFPYEPEEPPTADDTSSTPEGIRQVVEANNQFSFDLYNEMPADENVFYSPYSISSALAMTYEGAQGQTSDEIQQVFYFPQDHILRPNFAAIYNRINSPDSEYELRTGNALWIQKDYQLLDEYLSRVENYYGGKAAELDFEETEKSRQTINTFIEEQTNDKIKNLIPKGSLDRTTRLVLTNAIYFKGTWQYEFEKDKTHEADFYITPDNTVKVDMMHMSPDEAFNYADLEQLQVLELPYKGDSVSMIILLPKENQLVDISKLDQYKAEMKETKLDDIYLPKFEVETKYYLKQTLSSLGMPTAFSPAADFSGITGEKDLFIDQVIHQAYVMVDEEGTEAAAATAVDMKLTAMQPTNVFRADHPFTFVIQEKETGNILFLGHVVDPSE